MRVSGPAQRTALEVLAANNVQTVIQRDDGFTPTPVISRAILVYNRGRQEHLADGIVITPSHNPPEDGGFKYNPTDGGPADTHVTRCDPGPGQRAAARGQHGVKRVPLAAAHEGGDARARKICSCRMSRTCATSSTWRRSGRPDSSSPSTRSAAPPCTTGSRSTRLQAGHRGREPQGRSDVLVHDRRPRRQDPHGLLQSVCDGEPGRGSRTSTASRSPTTRTPTGTASSHRRWG